MTDQKNIITDSKAKLLPRITQFFFDRAWFTALIWVIVASFGILSYTTLLKREGFPSISIPLVIVNGVYGVNDPAKVDATIAAPVSEIALKQTGVQSVQTSSESNFVNATIQYEENTDPNKAKEALEKALKADGRLPREAKINFNAPYFGVTGGSVEKIDATISLYAADNNQSLSELKAKANRAVDFLNKQSANSEYIDKYFVQDPFQQVTNPLTGQSDQVQRTFERFGTHQGADTRFYRAVVIGVASKAEADVIKLDDNIRADLQRLQAQSDFNDIRTTVTASYAPSIKDNISELQRVLLEGLLAVLIVGSIVIAVRASLITVISMITVIATTLGVIYLLGYTLNVITLFALILGLSLIVDDTIIMVEAIDSARRRNTDRRLAVRQATQKIGRAMIAATFTAALSFAPLLFVGGILGSFIRAIPLTIISALLISLIVALIFIPLFARYLLLGKKQMGEGNVKEIAAGLEARIAHAITRPMLWARHSRAKEFFIGITAVVISLVFIGVGGYYFQKVAFNIFPPSKDTNQLAVAITYPSGTTVPQAEELAAQVDSKVSDVLGADIERASYYGAANNRSATLYVELTPYSKREATAPDLADQIDESLKDLGGLRIDAYPVDIGPPTSSFVVNIDATNRSAAENLAKDMASYLDGRQLTRPSGEKATITEASVGDTSVYRRSESKPVLSLSAVFDGTDTTTLTTLAQTTVNERYTPERLAQFGLPEDAISFNLGQESENQESFQSLAFAFPLVLIAIYILLIIQFRSLLQPLLIFMALPFSFFGIALGLYYTNNSFSFFAMLGFFALIGLSIKNTILLTDYANQARRSGMSAIDAAVGALGERFRPLIATSLTAVFSLIPLALTSPFWQGLAVVLIFGLLSSTFLVIFIFPYYYLGGEYLRMKIRRRMFLGWLLVTAAAGTIAWFVTKEVAAVLSVALVTGVALIAARIIFSFRTLRTRE